VQGRLRLDFPWLPMTILNNAQFVDHHLLFHLYAAPWMVLGGEVGVKLATVSIAAGVIVAAWAFLRQIGVQYAMLWALGLLAASSTFLYRMLMVRTQGAALLLVIIGAALLLVIIALMLVVARRDRWLLVLAFAYAWLYNGFVLLIGVVGLYALAVWIAERRILWKPVVYTVAGIALGLVINPPASRWGWSSTRTSPPIFSSSSITWAQKWTLKTESGSAMSGTPTAPAFCWKNRAGRSSCWRWGCCAPVSAVAGGMPSKRRCC